MKNHRKKETEKKRNDVRRREKIHIFPAVSGLITTRRKHVLKYSFFSLCIFFIKKNSSSHAQKFQEVCEKLDKQHFFWVENVN